MEQRYDGFSSDQQSLISGLINTFKDELPVLRAKVRVSQETLAQRLGISRQLYNSVEAGKREMTLPLFLALVAFFQNNQKTEKMVYQIDQFREGMDSLTDIQKHKYKKQECGESVSL